MSEQTTKTTPLRVWDLPTRLFHIALLLCVVGALASAKIGGAAMVWHLRLGEAVLVLLGFRLLWGVLGGYWSRWRRFVFTPSAIWRYVRRQPAPGELLDVGHNPLGAASALLMLAWLALQVGSGLIADDEVAFTGPLIRFVSSETSLSWTAHHKALGQWGLYALIGLHVLAVAWHSVLDHGRLLRAMLTGDKPLPPGIQASRDSGLTRLLALAVLLLSVAAVLWLLGLESPGAPL
jgi:cytochrome b